MGSSDAATGARGSAFGGVRGGGADGLGCGRVLGLFSANGWEDAGGGMDALGGGVVAARGTTLGVARGAPPAGMR